jgi:hypothetical protein
MEEQKHSLKDNRSGWQQQGKGPREGGLFNGLNGVIAISETPIVPLLLSVEVGFTVAVQELAAFVDNRGIVVIMHVPLLIHPVCLDSILEPGCGDGIMQRDESLAVYNR